MRYWVIVLFFAGMFVTPNPAVAQQQGPVVLARGQRAVVTGCDDVTIVIRRPAISTIPPLFRFEVGVSGGVLGAGTNYRTWVAEFEAALEYRLNEWAGVYAFGAIGGAGGLLEGKVNSVTLGALGVAFWPADYARIVLAGGYESIRNPSWNHSFGGPAAIGKLDFLIGKSGFGLGVTGTAGPGWTWTGDLATLYTVVGGIRWHFGGGERK